MRRQVSAIELHALDNVNDGFKSFALFNGDNAVFADLEERFCQNGSDGRVVIASQRRDLRDFLFALFVDLFGVGFNFSRDSVCRLGNAASQRHRVCTGGYVFQTFFINSFRQNGCRCRAVASNVVCFRRRFFNQLSAEVFFRIFQFNIFGYRYAVFGYLRGTPTFIQYDVSTTRT